MNEQMTTIETMESMLSTSCGYDDESGRLTITQVDSAGNTYSVVVPNWAIGHFLKTVAFVAERSGCGLKVVPKDA